MQGRVASVGRLGTGLGELLFVRVPFLLHGPGTHIAMALQDTPFKKRSDDARINTATIRKRGEQQQRLQISVHRRTRDLGNAICAHPIVECLYGLR